MSARPRTIELPALIAVLLCSLGGVTGIVAQTTLETNPTTGHSYFLTQSLGTWTAARNEAIAAGGHLVSIDDAAEQGWLIGRFPGSFWIGLSDTAVEGSFAWDSGQPFVYTNWAPGEPDDASPFCTMADFVWMANGMWYDTSLVSCIFTPQLRGIVEIPTTDIGLVAGSFTATPIAPAVLQPTTLRVEISNLGSMPVTPRITFYEGPPASGGVMIAQFMPTVPHGVTPIMATWTPATIGTRSLFAVLDNLPPSGDSPSNNQRSISVSVGAPLDQVSVSGSSLTTYAGATVSMPLTITNTGSGPTTIQTVDVLSPWASVPATLLGATLQPGQSTSGLVTLNVPASAPGSPPGTAPIVHLLPVAVTTALNTFSSALTVSLNDQPTATTTIRVVHQISMAPIANAQVVVQGIPAVFTTNGAGEVVLGVAAGPIAVIAYHPDFIARSVSAVVPTGPSVLTVALQPGATLEITQVVAQPLTTEEIIARGVNVSDPVNNVIVDFVVTLHIVNPPAPGAPAPPPVPTIVLPNVEIPMNPQPGTVYVVEGPAMFGDPTGPTAPIAPPAGSGGGGGGGGGTVWVSGEVVVNDHGQTETWIVVPGSVTILKQFYEVFALVVNNAQAPVPSDIQIQNSSLTLTLPPGLGLPDLNGIPQSLTQVIGTLDAGQSASASWVIRGDEPGTYALSGSSTGDLIGFGQPLASLSSVLVSQPFNVVLPQIRLDFATSTMTVAQGVPFTLDVLVTNEQVATANLVRVALDVINIVNAVPCPQAQQPLGTTVVTDDMGVIVSLENTLGDILPGETKTASFCLIPSVSGQIVDIDGAVSPSTTASPPVVITPLYPGFGDLKLLSGSNEPPNALPIKLSLPGETITLRYSTPMGTLVGRPLTLVGEFVPFINFAARLHPAIWVDANLFVLIDGFSGAPSPFVLGASDVVINAIVPPGFAGTQLLIQGIVVTPMTPPFFASSDAHEFRFF